MSDETLVTSYVMGDREAFNVLAERYREKLYRLAYRTLGNHDDAQDAVQETLVRLISALPTFEPRARFSTWLYRLAQNTCIDYLRRRKSITGHLEFTPETPVTHPGSDPDKACQANALEMVLARAMDQLPNEQRTLLVLRDREDRSNQEVADILGVEVGTLKSRLHRARAALRRILENGITVVEGSDLVRMQVTDSGALI